MSRHLLLVCVVILCHCVDDTQSDDRARNRTRAGIIDAGEQDITLDANVATLDASLLDASNRPDASQTHSDADVEPECESHEQCTENEYCAQGVCKACPNSGDCNSNGVEDSCEIIREISSDCNDNKLPDECDLATISLDCNQNSILDECEFIDNGCVTAGRRSYVEYIAGNIPVIVSAPHGGTLEPAEIPPRQGGTQVRDTNTTELARNFYYRMLERVGARPHVIFVNLHRTRLDANRALVEATEMHPAAVTAWEEYHKYIAAAKRSVVRHFGSGLYLDFHGLRSSRDKIELGYLLTGSQLELPDARISHPGYSRLSSIHSLFEQSDTSFEELLRGPRSFGTLLTNANYNSVPSMQFPDPGRDSSNNQNDYFSGGYNTFRHGSVQGGFISGIQLEHVWEGVRDTLSNRRAYCTALAEVTEMYLDEHFGLSVNARSLIEPESRYLEMSESDSRKTVTFHRRGDLSQTVTLEFEYSGTATLSEDFMPLPETAVFQAGSSEAKLEVYARDDMNIEGLNTLEIYVKTSTQYNFMLNADWTKRRSVTLALHDDERPSIQIRTNSTQFSEPSDTINVSVSSVPSNMSGEINIGVTGTAEPGADYQIHPPLSTEGNRISVSLSPSTPIAQIEIDAKDDMQQEGRESILFTSFASTSFSPPLFSPHLFLDDDDTDSALIEWWPGRIENEYLSSNLPQRPLPVLLPNDSLGPRRVSGPRPSLEAIRFDGIDDVIVAKDVEFVTPLSSQSTELTISLWLRMTNLPRNSFGYILSHASNTFGRFNPPEELIENSRDHLHIYFSQSGTLKTAVRGSTDENGFSALDSPSPLQINQWYHYALVIKKIGASTSSHVYIDGIEVNSALRGGNTLDPIGPIHIGGRYDFSSTRHFEGDVSDIRFYQRALNVQEIRELMNVN